MKSKFWMVLGSWGPPVVQHPTREAAAKEAERLALQHSGTTFTVLESMASVVKSDIRWEDHDTEGPF